MQKEHKKGKTAAAAVSAVTHSRAAQTRYQAKSEKGNKEERKVRIVIGFAIVTEITAAAAVSTDTHSFSVQTR
jgi:hypothetical protein